LLIVDYTRRCIVRLRIHSIRKLLWIKTRVLVRRTILRSEVLAWWWVLSVWFEVLWRGHIGIVAEVLALEVGNITSERRVLTILKVRVESLVLVVLRVTLRHYCERLYLDRHMR
jgi:hypothetical protein